MVGNGLGEDDLEGGVKRVGKSWDEEIGLVGVEFEWGIRDLRGVDFPVSV